MIYVPGEGNPCADLAIVGEAPAAFEEEAGRPFVGPSGSITMELLNNAGVSREETWITNVSKYRLPKALNPRETIEARMHRIGLSYKDAVDNLWKELREINPKAILALGDSALVATTGKHGIKNYRGSILESIQGLPKVIPTYHPAHLLHQSGGEIAHYSAKVYMQFDFNRAIEQSKFRAINRPLKNLWICRDSMSFCDYLRRNEDKEWLSVDIESVKCIPMCIGLSFEPFTEGVCIPLTDKNISLHQLVYLWKDLAKLLEGPTKKIGQNFKYDQPPLLRMGFPVKNFTHDTMLASHTLYPELPKSLGFLTSIYTEEPYYKDEGRKFDPKKDRPDQFYIYNTKDAVYTGDVFMQQRGELEETGLEHFFYDFVMQLHPLYMEMERLGVRVDFEARAELLKKYEADLFRDQLQLNTLVGYDINVNSPKQVPVLLYNQLGLPARQGADADVIVGLMNNVKKAKDPRIQKILTLILKVRKVRKLIGTYIKAKPDYDDRMRTSVNIVGTETGRTSNSILQPPVRPEKLGLAFQTLSKYGEVGTEFRCILIPDPGYVLLEADLSQAEARVVCILAEDEETLMLFDTADIHKLTASWCYETAPGNIDKLQRQVGKMVRHAADYDAGKGELMRRIATQSQKMGLDIQMSEWKAGKMLEIFHNKSPKIRGVFHAGIREALSNSRVIITPMGRRREFFGRWDDDLFKEGYAHIPQSTVSDVLKQGMLRTKRAIPNLQILIESHDAFTCQVKPEDLDFTARTIKECMEFPIDFNGCTLSRNRQLVIPVELQTGHNWRDMVKYELAQTVHEGHGGE